MIYTPKAEVPDWLERFITESNRIEGIHGAPTGIEIQAHETFLSRSDITIDDLTQFVAAIAPGHRLRDAEGLNVRVGDHRPPPGGPYIARRLIELLDLNSLMTRNPYLVHQDYETLHPFTDGNGRSGRVLWLWQCLRRGAKSFDRVRALGFLHSWYYQSLENGR